MRYEGTSGGHVFAFVDEVQHSTANIDHFAGRHVEMQPK